MVAREPSPSASVAAGVQRGFERRVNIIGVKERQSFRVRPLERVWGSFVSCISVYLVVLVQLLVSRRTG